jgi:DNA-binding NtrC family response regulator
LLLLCRKLLNEEVPVIVISSALDASLATRAYAFGARDFLEKPLDIERVRFSLERLLFPQNPELPSVKALNEKILGNSRSLRAALQQIAKIIPYSETRVLLVGESGTGKELLAQGIHALSADPTKPCVAVNVGAIPRDLVESQLFGHEKGAFTSAFDSHRGYLEEAEDGTLFLDEIGELELPLQVKLLRVIQERKFRRLKGTKDLDFKGRLICATNKNLTNQVNEGSFRSDLFHRIAQVIVNVPPLREREGDIDLLLEHFLREENTTVGKTARFSREALTILRSYSFPGNIRDLQNLVHASVIACDGNWILPEHLPLKSMGTLTQVEETPKAPVAGEQKLTTDSNGTPSPDSKSHAALFDELQRVLPNNWLDLPYKKMLDEYQHAFDRIYLPLLIHRYRHNVTQATKAAGVDKKTFDRHWKEAGLKPLRSREDSTDD